ncbi:MAG TPA: NAD(P)/FAD-dependent oxidoreductase [Candidatus Limnocylindria bacterium]|jgi:dihydrolipoamide dehydrogenase|nr:NAD(P)/FAD-dependent oxidoreductase [Candidatus Limnocylindria bacterium]
MSEGPFDFVIIGAGASGEAAAHYAQARGASVAIVDRDLFGGSCPFWACMPSKTLLHAAEVRAHGGDYPWLKASDRRDYMIVREHRDYPDDGDHVRSLERSGATVVRGTARLAGAGRVAVTHDGRAHDLVARNVIIAVGSVGKVPPLEGLAEAGYWTNVEATSTRTLPRSMVVLGAGPSGVEIAQYFARFDVRTAIVAPHQVNPTDHPRSSRLLAETLRRSGVDVRTGVRALRVRPQVGPDGERAIDLSDGSSVTAEIIQLSVGRTSARALTALGLDTIGVAYDGADTLTVGDDLRVAGGVYAVGDAIGHELSTHLGHYEGEMAVRIALGDDVRVDFSAIPRVVYTDPETAAVGLRLEEARQRGIDAFEEALGLPKTSKGYIAEADIGHVTIVVDRANRIVVGAFIGGVGAGEAIHQAVLAIKLRTPIETLAQTVNAFPTTARELGGLFASAALKLR